MCYTFNMIAQLTAQTENIKPYYTGEATTSTGFYSIFLMLMLIFLSFGAVLAFLVYLYSKKVKKEDAYKKSLNYKLFLIRVPLGNEHEIKAAEQMFGSLYAITKKKKLLEKLFKADEGISFEVIAYPNYIGFFVYVPKKFAPLVEKQILGAYQDAEVVEVPEPNIFKEGGYVDAGYFELTDKEYMPIKTYVDYEEKIDPLASVVGSFANMIDGEGGILQILISPVGMGWSKKGQKFVDKTNAHNNNPENKNKIPISQEKLNAITKKCSKVGFNTHIRVVISAPTKELAEARMATVAGAFSQFTNPGINSFKLKHVSPKNLREFMNDFIYRRIGSGKHGSVLNIEELATIYHFPNKKIETPGIDWLVAKKAPPPPNLPKSGLWIGTSIYRGIKKPVYIGNVKDRRRHMYIIGQTGVGKSYFMANMILQDIYNNQGVAVLDPHGSLIEEVVRRIPAHRAEDVIYFNPADTERPFGINILEHRNEYEKHEIVNSFLALMKKMFDPHDQGIVGPRFERTVRNAMLLVMEDPNTTLVEVLRAIADESYAKSFLPILKDDEVRLFWEKEMANTDRFHKSEILGWITSKFDRFVTNITIRNIIGQSKSSFDFRDIMDNGKILLINLSQGLIGTENAQFLGLLIIPRILRAALSREDTPEEKRRDFFLYVDEFQNFATEEFAKILSEARKYRLSLIVANQYIAQMIDKVRDAIFGNVGTLVSFRVGATDAEYLEKEFAPVFSQQDLIRLENANAYIKTLINGVTVPPFSMSTFYNMEQRFPKNERIAELIKKLSRLKYGRPVELVKEDIKKRAHRTAKSTPVTSGSKPPLVL